MTGPRHLTDAAGARTATAHATHGVPPLEHRRLAADTTATGPAPTPLDHP
ncbi:hypothetical protein [Streptomyces pactum]|nr:hypothetical protein [Streptomyces pactum]